MAVFDELRRASYKSVPFFVTATTTPAGIKHVKHVFPNSSNQVIEELGLRQRTYNISAILTSNANGSGYFINRDRLLRALEAGGIGTLIHPFYGRIPSLKAVSWSPTETMNAVGEYVVDIVFEEHQEQDVPVSAGFSLSQVFQDVTDFISAVTTDIESTYGVVNSFVSNISDGISQVEQFGDAVTNAISIAAQLPDQITIITDQIIQLFDTSATIATTPSLLASTTTDIFDSIDDLYADPAVTLEVTKRLFTFGDDDVPVIQPTTEPASTNQLLFSEEFDNAAYTKTEVTVTPDNSVAPDGTITMDLIVPTVVNTSHTVLQDSSITDTVSYTHSVFAKAGGYSILQLAPSTGFPTTNTWVNFDLSTGIIGNRGGEGIASIDSVGGGIYRCILTVTANSTEAAGRVIMAPLDADTAARLPSFIGDTVSGVDLWGAQLEALPFVTSYIRTTTTAVTRNLPIDTVVLQSRESNRDLYRSTVQGLALSYAYLNASRIDFTTVEAIEAEEVELEAQYDKVVAVEGFTEETKAALTELRIITSDFFAEQKITANQIITVRTNTLSTRLLAYQYYGASVENAPIINDLNNVTDNTFISGDVEIITA